METMKFEDAMKRLDEITAKLQDNSCSLDEGLALFEEGIALSRICSEKLKSYEQRLQELSVQQGENHD